MNRLLPPFARSFSFFPFLFYRLVFHAPICGGSTPDGGHYEGEFYHNRKHGMGKMIYPEGAPEASYNGSWANDQPSGLGILVMANGDRFEGHWLNGKKEGPGRYFYQATCKVLDFDDSSHQRTTTY